MYNKKKTFVLVFNFYLKEIGNKIHEKEVVTICVGNCINNKDIWGSLSQVGMNVSKS